MKKNFYLIFVLIILLTGCGYTGISLNDVSIDFTDSNSVVVLKREYTERQIIKVYDEEGQALLLMIPYMDEDADQLMANNIELPDGITVLRLLAFLTINIVAVRLMFLLKLMSDIMLLLNLYQLLVYILNIIKLMTNQLFIVI